MGGTKLKNMKLTSVDLVPQGANPDADICLFKSADNLHLKDDEKNVLKKFFGAIASLFGFEDHMAGGINKGDSKTFADIDNTREYRELLWRYESAFSESIYSILNDEDLDDTARLNELNTSLGQYAEKLKELFTAMTSGENTPIEGTDPQTKTEKTLNKGEIDMAKIDKSLLSAEEQTTLEALMKKCTVEDGDPAPAPAPSVDPAPAVEPKAEPAAQDPAPAPAVDTQKSVDPTLAKALAEVDDLRKSIEMGQLKEIAKKYVPLGKKEEELAQTLYDLKKSGQANYDAYIKVLDESLDLVNKSGVFAELGKSTHGPVSMDSGVVAQVEGIAKGYRDADPTLDYNTSMMRAWENNPELLAQYEKGAK